METHWSLGILIGTTILLLVLGGLVFGVIAFGRIQQREAAKGGPYSDEGVARGFKWGCVVCVVLTLGLAASPAGYYPYSAQYHQWQPKSGVVSDVNKRIIGSSGDINQKFVVRFQGSQQEYGCEDTRCAVIGEGDKVELSCKRAWQYAGSDGWDCNFYRNLGGAK